MVVVMRVDSGREKEGRLPQALACAGTKIRQGVLADYWSS